MSCSGGIVTRQSSVTGSMAQSWTIHSSPAGSGRPMTMAPAPSPKIAGNSHWSRSSLPGASAGPRVWAIAERSLLAVTNTTASSSSRAVEW
ncbi:hypothetical protein [Streptomyces microflavus]|uniref:hypothetical protein n=1 Tax=Streptomyces microflavus TaxID=1919 RepID=UPI003305706F